MVPVSGLVAGREKACLDYREAGSEVAGSLVKGSTFG